MTKKKMERLQACADISADNAVKALGAVLPGELSEEALSDIRTAVAAAVKTGVYLFEQVK